MAACVFVIRVLFLPVSVALPPVLASLPALVGLGATLRP